MDDALALVAATCVVLSFLVYLMWRSATAPSWGELTHNEKRRWRVDEEKRKEKA